MSDKMVLATQQWLNETYKNKTGYVSIKENGETGWNTIYALRRALQIELGIISTSSNFGPSTTAKFKARFPNGVQQQSPDDETENNIYGIIQGACWCKGYSTGASSITKHFYSGTGKAIQKLKSDAGCSDSSSTVSLNVMKALLSMDQFQILGLWTPTKEKIQKIQQALNNEYEDYIGLSPCDGAYGRAMNESLIKVLQAIEGYSVDDATGNFGAGTKAKLPIVPSNTLNSDTQNKAIKLVRYCLCCNGYDVSITSGSWDDNLGKTIQTFQSDMCISTTNSCDVNTWMALLLSKGNTDRSFTACDTAYTIKGARIQDLKDRGITTIGRYIIGGNTKELEFEEEKTIINNGFKLFPIYQTNGTPSIDYFKESQGILDSAYSYRGAQIHCIPENSIIYFAVDIDATDTQITNNILPYFKALKENVKAYRVGIYGTRNVCTRVMEKGYAVTCFVSDMSTGYSGNMGFKMPEKWNFDQFDTMAITNSEGKWYIDKVASSGKFDSVDSLSARYIYEGDVSFTDTNGGRQLLYGGKELRAYITVTDVNDNPIDNVAVMAEIRAVEGITNPYYDDVMAVYAEADGNVHTFMDTILEGNVHYNKDFMRILNDVHYYVKCSVYKDSKRDSTQRVKVHINIETND